MGELNLSDTCPCYDNYTGSWAVLCDKTYEGLHHLVCATHYGKTYNTDLSLIRKNKNLNKYLRT